MDWLQALDVNVFRFINGTLTNPFFDKLMPFVSGNVFFAPVLGVLAILLIGKTRERGLICVVMLGVIVGTCDGVICRTLKHAIGRPRPFNVLSNVNRPGRSSLSSGLVEERAGLPSEVLLTKEGVGRPTDQKTVERTGTIPPNPPALTGNSMPSAHAANWFAATMVALVYFRKSICVMLPLACLVSFSRIYNGVHYPSDVIAGAIIGAGHAVAMLWLLNTLWQWAGPKCLPRLYSSMPSLTSSKKSSSSSSS